MMDFFVFKKFDYYNILLLLLFYIFYFLKKKDALLNGISPGMYQTLRALMSAPFLVVAAVFVDGKKFIPSRKMEFAHFALIGLFGIALNGILYSAGLQLSPPKIAGILQPGKKKKRKKSCGNETNIIFYYLLFRYSLYCIRY